MRPDERWGRLLSEAPPPPGRRSLARSDALKAQAERLIPSLSQTFSKAPFQFVQGVAPVFVERAEGYRVWDVDGNAYTDWSMALAAVILAYADPDVAAAVVRQLGDGTLYTLSHPLEVEVSQRLVDLIPCAEMVRFGKNGSDATSGAVRLARAVTRRDIIACCGYHGWQDWYVGTTTRNRGVPDAVSALTQTFAYNDLDSLARLFQAHPDQIAAVIMEPVGITPPAPGFLEGVQDLCQRHGALLVFDEVITGFRLALGGAQAYFGVTPDLACVGKGMANGFPLSAIVGPERFMRHFDEVFFSFTYGGETLALAACAATIDKLQSQQVIPRLWETGQALKDGVEYLLDALEMSSYVTIQGYAPRTVLQFRDREGNPSMLYKSLFQQECLKRGVLFTGAHNVCFSHDDEAIWQTLAVYRAAFEILAEAIANDGVEARLEGPPVQPVFRQP